MGRMVSYPWPGNVRELENAIEYAFVVCQERTIDAGDLPGELSAPPSHDESGGDDSGRLPAKPTNSRGMADSRKIFDRMGGKKILRSKKELTRLLEENLWNKAEVGRLLGVSRTAVWKWIEKHGIKSQSED